MRKTVSTGTLTLDVAENRTGLAECDLFDVAARANPKRGFLIVSKLIGRHLPTRPAVMRGVMADLAALVDADAPGPVLFLGMAETAVGLGQGVHAAWCDRTGRSDAWFIQSTRQTHPDMEVWTTFEEGHSHASSHLVHRPVDIDAVAAARTLVIVDDECSTGRTFVGAEAAMRTVLPNLERCIDVVITDWAPPSGRERVSVVSGSMTWEPNGETAAVPGSNANEHGRTRPDANPARRGYRTAPGLMLSRLPAVAEGERVTVVSDGENSYDALRVAEELERRGAVAAVQSITRSPAHVGGAMQSRALFDDAHGSGATCYSYNLEGHGPDRYVVVVEATGGQCRQLAAATGRPERDVERVEMIR